MSNGNDETQTQNGIEKPLIDVLDSNYPLLKKFREICPGTFKHSQNVVGLAEGISVSLGLDTTFMKIAAQYHDIGKMLNPKYFTENQLDENPHDKLEPFISYQIITRHVSDTALILLNDDNFSRDIIKIICQHHGTSVVRYFFDKSGGDVEDIFRYKCSRPTCVESAILMICDQIEARTRADLQAGRTSSTPSEVIEETINELLSDGQLDDVVMRLGDLQRIKDALAKELESTFHKRVDYKKAKSNKIEKSKEKDDLEIN